MSLVENIDVNRKEHSRINMTSNKILIHGSIFANDVMQCINSNGPYIHIYIYTLYIRHYIHIYIYKYILGLKVFVY